MTEKQPQEPQAGVAINEDGISVVLPNGDEAQVELTAKLLSDPHLALAWAQLVVSHQAVVQQGEMARALTALAATMGKLANPEVNTEAHRRRMQESMDMAFGLVERMLPGMNLKDMMKVNRPNGG